MTGPRLLNFKEAVGVISTAVGRPIHYEQITVESYASMLREFQVPEDEINLISYLFNEVLDGRNAYVTDGVRKALKREPTDFTEFVRKTAPMGVWNKSLNPAYK